MVKQSIAKPAWWFAGAAAVSSYVLFFPKELRIPCLFNYCTGLLCPGCGTTRALTALFHGDFVAAFSFNQLIWFIPVFILAFDATKNLRNSKQIHLILVVLTTLVAAAFFVVRNGFV